MSGVSRPNDSTIQTRETRSSSFNETDSIRSVVSSFVNLYGSKVKFYKGVYHVVVKKDHLQQVLWWSQEIFKGKSKELNVMKNFMYVFPFFVSSPLNGICEFACR